MTYTVELWHGPYDDMDSDEPLDEVELEEGEHYVWQDDPYFRGRVGFRIAEEDCPATLFVYLDDSVRPPGEHSPMDWDIGPLERGLTHYEDEEYGPFKTEIAGRVMFFVEGGA